MSPRFSGGTGAWPSAMACSSPRGRAASSRSKAARYSASKARPAAAARAANTRAASSFLTAASLASASRLAASALACCSLVEGSSHCAWSVLPTSTNAPANANTDIRCSMGISLWTKGFIPVRADEGTAGTSAGARPRRSSQAKRATPVAAYLVLSGVGAQYAPLRGACPAVDDVSWDGRWRATRCDRCGRCRLPSAGAR